MFAMGSKPGLTRISGLLGNAVDNFVEASSPRANASPRSALPVIEEDGARRRPEWLARCWHPTRMMLGGLPPSSSETFFKLPVAACTISLPTSVEPVNATLSTSLMSGQRGAGGFAEIQGQCSPRHPGSRLPESVRRAQSGKRGLLRGLERHGAAGRQRRPQLPGGHEQREIPGNIWPTTPTGSRSV